uniref:Pre-mRNA 3'-end-processing factor FIP1 n=1 Tax=Romanomermis culicivorax TaxID=13658 RepID=A0A915JEK2_ROMCU
MSEEAEAEILAEIANVAQDGLSTVDNVADPTPDVSDQQNDVTNGILNEEIYDDPGTPLGDEDQARPESEEEDDIQITIGDIRSNVTTQFASSGVTIFRPQGTGAQRGAVVGGTGAAKQGQKLDLDATAEVNGSSIYDLDISLLEERPWRKPGADLTDYFNYGFTEESWLVYCDRQKKLRSEYGAAANKVLFASIPATTTVLNNSTNLGSNLQTQQKQHQHGEHCKIIVIISSNLVTQKIVRSASNESTGSTSNNADKSHAAEIRIAAKYYTANGFDTSRSYAGNAIYGLAQRACVYLTQLLQNMQQQAGAHLDSSPPVSPGGTPPLSDEFPTRQTSDVPVTLATTSIQSQITASTSVDVSGPPPSVTVCEF